MDAARLHGPHDVRVAREAVPVPGPGEELVRVTTVGLCGSDLHWFDDARIGATVLGDPLVLGHEAVGVIAAGPRRGMRVALEPAAPCGACATCREGRGWLCPSGRFAGHAPVDGALRELMAWPAELLVPLPDTIGDPDAALLEPLGVALHALDLASVAPGMSAAVVGCGPIGLLIIRALRAAGVNSIDATDPLEHRLRAAADSGATAVTAADAAGDVDVAFDASGEPDAVAAAVMAVRPAGRVVLVGITGSEVTAFPAATARRKELTLIVCRRMTADDLPRAIELVADGRIQLDGLVNAQFSLAEAPTAFAALAERRGLKVVVRPGAAP